MSTEILVHSEQLSERTIKALLAAGVIPVRVKDVSSVRLLNSEPSVLPADALLRAALDAFCANLDNYGDKRLNQFVRNLKLLAPMPTPIPEKL